MFWNCAGTFKDVLCCCAAVVVNFYAKHKLLAGKCSKGTKMIDIDRYRSKWQ
jgi:hypothetical protein